MSQPWLLMLVHRCFFSPHKIELNKKFGNFLLLAVIYCRNKAKFSYVIHNPDPVLLLFPLSSTELNFGAQNYVLQIDWTNAGETIKESLFIVGLRTKKFWEQMRKNSLVLSEVCINISEMPMWKTGKMVKLSREKMSFHPLCVTRWSDTEKKKDHSSLSTRRLLSLMWEAL